jgi:tRNA threonylcarbamoyl adenosine modification protein (Sua5/YciO/YrdC/YwlC family)
MSILCSDMEMFCRYTRHLDTPTFRILKQILPGPYTVLLPASREVPRYLQNKQVVGLRIPDQAFCLALVGLLGEPIITTSVALPDQTVLNTAWEIEEELGHALDLVVDCGQPLGIHSTIVDLSGDEPTLVREGAGPWPL